MFFFLRSAHFIKGSETPSTVVVLTPREKPLITISRSMSLLKRASLLPVTPIAHSNPESAHGRNIAAPATPSSNRKGVQRQIARSLSIPLNGKECGIRRRDSFFRVIPSTPRVKEGDENEISNGSQVADCSWRAWEDEAHMDRHDYLHEITREMTLRRQTTFVRYHASNPLTRNNFLMWVTCFFHQFGRSVVRSDYLTLRKGFM